ncbi:MAG: hypothetical protein ABR550_12555, partial [Wenzhouxiangellaceae bacterium]
MKSSTRLIEKDGTGIEKNGTGVCSDDTSGTCKRLLTAVFIGALSASTIVHASEGSFLEDNKAVVFLDDQLATISWSSSSAQFIGSVALNTGYGVANVLRIGGDGTGEKIGGAGTGEKIGGAG